MLGASDPQHWWSPLTFPETSNIVIQIVITGKKASVEKLGKFLQKEQNNYSAHISPQSHSWVCLGDNTFESIYS